MTDDNISGWIPNWLTAREQLAAEGPALLALQGRRIVNSWVVWKRSAH